MKTPAISELSFSICIKDFHDFSLNKNDILGEK